ncbi:MAG TPA: RNA polymerase sigma factor [Nitrospirae bacterium]|nr:RNA polymerase sigma factor [Nitrospirota bacterium]
MCQGITTVNLKVKCRKGQFEKIYDSCKNRIYNYLYRMTGDKEEAADLTQEVFLKAYRGLDNFNGRADITTWIYKIAINTYRNILRVKKPQITSLENNNENEISIIYKSIPQLKQVEVKELEGCMQKFLNDLPDTYRIPLILYELQGLRIHEISEIMNVSDNNIKIRLVRARVKLKEIMCTQCCYFNPKNPCNCKGEDWNAK